MTKNSQKRKSNKKILFLLVLVISALPICSKPIDENSAREVAAKVLSHSVKTNGKADVSTEKEYTPRTMKLLNSSNSGSINGTAYFYVFVTENNDGFVIVSGDDRVTPVLGYSDTNGFSTDNIPPNLAWWLGEYAKQIQFAIENDIEPTKEVQQQWAQYLGINNNGKEE